ncbi:MAG: lytic murein transglycosylase [Nocardioides sp.]|nr:lytic murein transglycosylase [Nocardioides sp.]
MKFDRAVGPMQFIPSTWSVVGVDADSDGKRNPQDIDDAALAAAVYLCSGDDNLSTPAGQKAAIYRYNHSNSYVDLVRSITEAYTNGNFTSVPNNTTSAVTFTPDYDYVPPTKARAPKTKTPDVNSGQGTPSEGTGNGDSTPTNDPGTNPSPDNKPESNQPSTPPKDKPDPVKDLKKKGEKVGKDLEDSVKHPEKIIPKTLTRTQATLKCLASGLSKLDVFGLGKCVDRLLGL